MRVNRLKIQILTVCLLIIMALGCKEKANDDAATQSTYEIAEVHTSYGTMVFWLYNQTPMHKAKFIELAKAEHYNQFTFNRVVKNFVIQGGCPDLPQYFEGSPYLLDPEFVDSLKHSYGALGMGRDDNPKKQSNACQFYIVNKEAGLPNLDGNYMIFGTLISGKDVLESIEQVKTNAKDEPEVSIPLDVRIVAFTKTELSERFGFVMIE